MCATREDLHLIALVEVAAVAERRRPHGVRVNGIDGYDSGRSPVAILCQARASECEKERVSAKCC
jgi:hypothetical protein